jgi:hypothetical protein
MARPDPDFPYVAGSAHSSLHGVNGKRQCSTERLMYFGALSRGIQSPFHILTADEHRPIAANHPIPTSIVFASI